MAEPVQHVDIDREKHDVNVRAIFWFSAIFIASAVVIHVALYFLFVAFRQDERRKQPEPVTLVQRGPQLPPEPRLQPFPEQPPKWQGAQQRSVFHTPVDDMRQLQQQENAILNHYAWVDQSKGTVRIPIERAMQLVVERGLPVRQPVAAPTPAAPEPVPGSPESAVQQPVPTPTQPAPRSRN